MATVRPTDATPTWADGTSAAIVEPTSGKKSQGWLAQEKPPHQHFNWFWNLVSRWLTFFDDALFHEAGENGQHDEDGDHWEVRVKGDSAAVKLRIDGTSGEATSTHSVESYSPSGVLTFFLSAAGRIECAGAVQATGDVSGANVVSSGYVSAAGAVSGDTVSQTDTTNRTEVVPGLAGQLISSGTRVEVGAGLGYDENDATTRTIRYWAPKMPEHAILRSVKVITTPGHVDNSIDAELWETDNATNSTKTSHGTITTQTGVTGNQSATVAISGTLTQAGARGWWIDVAITNNNALGAYVNKVVWDYDITRL